MVLWALILELGIAILGYGFLDGTDTTLIISLGGILTPSPLPKMELLFTFDELSAAL